MILTLKLQDFVIPFCIWCFQFLNNFNRMQKNFYYMEKRLRFSRKSACTRIQNAENMNPDTSSFECDEQVTAKNMLFQLAENQYEPVDGRKPFQKLETLKINQWFKTQAKPHKKDYFTPTRKTTYLRRTVHIRPFVQLKQLHPFDQYEQNLEQSIIPHLKQQLRKLESPEKRRQFQQKKKRLEYLQQKIKRKKDLVMVEELIQNKRSSIRVKKSQSQKKPTSLMFFNNFSQGKARHVFKQRDNNETKDPSQQIYMIKQARKHRTLKNLLL